MDIGKLIWKYEHPYIFRFVFSFICIIISTFIASFLPHLVGKIIDYIIAPENIFQLVRLIVYFLFAFFLNQMVSFFQIKTWASLMNDVCKNVRADMFHNVLNAKSTLLDKLHFGDIISRMNDDVEHFIFVVHANGFFIISSFFQLTIALIYLFSVHWSLALSILLTSICVFSISKMFANHSKKTHYEYKQQKGSTSSWINEILRGIEEIRLLAASKYIVHQWCKKNALLSRYRVDQDRTEYTSKLLARAANLIAQLVIYVICAWLVINREITIGSFFSAMILFSNCTAALHSINQKLSRFHYNILSIHRVAEVLDIDQDALCNDNPCDSCNWREITITQLSFAYDQDSRVLSDINIHINPGEHVYLIGESGAGKTTLISLICGLYSPPPNTIFFGKVPIENVTISELRRHIAIMHQENILFEGSVRYNLIFSNNQGNDDYLTEVLAMVGLGNECLPQGLDSQLYPSGKNLSSGQRQRLILARMIVKDPDVLILDEATRALDQDASQELQKLWEEIFFDRTIIFVTHKLTLLRPNDKVAIIRNGRLSAFGLLKDIQDSFVENRELLTTTSGENDDEK